MYEKFFEMTDTPFTRGIPVDMLYRDRDTEEIYNRLVYAADKQLFALLVGVMLVQEKQPCCAV